MKSRTLLLVAACACCPAVRADEGREVWIESRIRVEKDADVDAVVKELRGDGEALTRKYRNAEGVQDVRTTVNAEESRCEACSGGGKETKCSCGKPRPRATDEETKCACGKPRPRCGCGKPRPRCDDCASAAAKEECTECEGHVQAEDKITKAEDGTSLCSECNKVLRSCNKCKKCCSCSSCKKCCRKCCCSSSSSSCSSCCK